MGARESTESRQQQETPVVVEKREVVGNSLPQPQEKDEFEGKEPVVEELITPVQLIKPMSVMNAPSVRKINSERQLDSSILIFFFIELPSWLSNGCDGKVPQNSLNSYQPTSYVSVYISYQIV